VGKELVINRISEIKIISDILKFTYNGGEKHRLYIRGIIVMHR